MRKRRFLESSGQGKSFSETDLDDIRWLLGWLSHAVPRPITCRYSGPPVLLFTDGACEPTAGPNEGVNGVLVTCGAVLLDRRDNKALYFGIRISNELVEEWIVDSGKKQLVTEAELLPQLLARRLWAPRLCGTKLISFVDSEPSKFSLIKGTSDSQTCSDIVACVAMEDYKLMVWPWYARVPSFSNVADAPSRLRKLKPLHGFELVEQVPEQPKTLRGGVWNRA